ncbi:MAG: hypothetical protein K0S06_3195 [Microvirga sp.]|jgi:hypothetical protein|nr:hypothetical protein [Microvirga sp.]
MRVAFDTNVLVCCGDSEPYAGRRGTMASGITL